MLKTPRFLLTAGLALALVFTFSCSGDDGDSPPATLPSSSDAGVSQLPSSPSAALSSSSEHAALSSSSHDEELVEVSSSSEEESSSSATPPPYIPPYNPPYIPPTPSSSSLAYVPCQGRMHYGPGPDGIMYKEEFCDERDDHEYVYVEIGDQTWMAQNLNYVVEDTIIEGSTVIRSRCYNDEEANCIIYGRLYDWATAMGFDQECNANNCASQIQSPHRGICPKGWHIPVGTSGKSGWTPLDNFIKNNNSTTQAGNVLKANASVFWPYEWTSGTGMYEPPDPELSDKYGFSALPAGAYVMVTTGAMPTKGYLHLGIRTSWWYAQQQNNNGGSNTSAWVKFLQNTREDAPGASALSKTNFFSVRCIKDF